MIRRKFAFATVLILLAIPITALGAEAKSKNVSTTGSGKVRVYYIAAEEVDWDYAPGGINQITGKKYDFGGSTEARGALDPNAAIYRKALYREYTDATFKVLKPRPRKWEYLGLLGPLIRAEVGDTIRVVFKNNASRPYSIHPHGVFYTKDFEGAAYEDGTTGKDKADDAIPLDGAYTYVWQVPERAGPAHGDGPTAFWFYHSHVDEGRDINSGLIGPLIITGRGMARADGSPRDIDREIVAHFALFDEHLSWYWGENQRRIYGEPGRYDGHDKQVHDFHHFYVINGYMDGDGPMMTMRKGERVRWYMFANPNDEESWDIHTPHWHGQSAVVGHMRMDMVTLNPAMSVVADMVPDNPGIWLFHCHMPGHYEAGMRTKFEVLPAEDAQHKGHSTH